MFAGALEQPQHSREEWLASACPDAELRSEVNQLIAALQHAGDFLEDPPPGIPNAALTLGLQRADAPRFLPGQALGRYEIENLLGAGGMGEVYRARDTRLDRIVVLKVLPSHSASDPAWRARLEREARAVSSLNHPHVCALYDIASDEGTDFLVMEYLEGETLARRLERGPLSVSDVLLYGSDIAEGLAAAHQQGLIHRDLKPANIMLTSVGAKLLDFGVAKPLGVDKMRVAEAADSGAALTEHGTLIGTAAYMSPEQIDGQPVDERSDVFSVGALLSEMVTGQRAFAGHERTALFEAIREQKVPPIRATRPSAPRALEHLIDTCLQKDARRRCQTAEEVGRELNAIAARQRQIRRSRWVAAALLTLVAGLAAAWPAVQRLQPAPLPPGDTVIALAVLPFVNEGRDPSEEYLSDGLTDGLITDLAGLQPARLTVVGRASTARYRQTRSDTTQIGRDLGVAYFLTGSTSRGSGNIRVEVRLSRASDQALIWADRYEGAAEHLLIVQAEVAGSVARALSLVVPAEQHARLAARRPIDPVAHEHYLKGRYFWNKRTEDGLKRAVDHFEAAINRRPEYAAAYAGIADAHLLLAYYAFVTPAEAFGRARVAAVRALELDKDLAEAHVSLAGVDNWDHRWTEADERYQQALRLNPSYPTAHQWYANNLMMQGRRAEAQARILRARELDPLSLIIQVNVANVFLLSREYDRAIDECRKALTMDPAFLTARWVLGRAQELKGDYGAAIAEYERALVIQPGSSLILAALARTHARRGAAPAAAALLQELQRIAKDRYVSALDLATVHAAMGHADAAFTSLERAMNERANLLGYLKVDPVYDSLRGDARFSHSLNRLGLQ